jgi:hypothetical protein
LGRGATFKTIATSTRTYMLKRRIDTRYMLAKARSVLPGSAYRPD